MRLKVGRKTLRTFAPTDFLKERIQGNVAKESASKRGPAFFFWSNIA